MTSKKYSVPRLLLRDARIVLWDRIAEDSSLLLDNGRIAAVIPTGADLPAAGSELSLKGLTLFPGFIDVHIHGAVGVDIMAVGTNDLQRVSKFLSTRGVTSWLPTLVPAPQEQYENAIAAIHGFMAEQSEPLTGDDTDSQGAKALGVHYEGPFVNSLQCGALHSDHFQTYTHPSQIDRLPVPKRHRARGMITLAPEIEGGIELVKELTRRGWIVSIGHTSAAVEVLDLAHTAGARHMTHFMNAMAPLHHRAPGPIAWGLARDDVTCDLIADGVHLDPLVLRLLVKFKEANRLLLISDAIAAAGMGDGDYAIWDESISVRNGRTSNARGSIAGSVITMLEAVQMMLSLGVSEVQVALMAATNPAQLLRVESECGSIEEGKAADLVALDQRGNVALTVVGGVVAYQRTGVAF